MDCGSCGQRLSLPASHTGRFQCPTCGSEQDLAAAAPVKEDPLEALSDRYDSARTLAMRLNIAGIAVGVLAILVFFRRSPNLARIQKIVPKWSMRARRFFHAQEAVRFSTKRGHGAPSVFRAACLCHLPYRFPSLPKPYALHLW